MFFKSLFHKLFYLIWFAIIPLTVSWLLVDLLDRIHVVDEFEPWYVLLIFALSVMGLYAIRDYLPFWKDQNPNSLFFRRRQLNIARKYATYAEKAVRRHQKKLTASAISELTESSRSTLDAVRTRDVDQALQMLDHLKLVCEKHLSFMRKSASREYIESIGVAVFIALILRLFAIEAFKIPSESMVPSLMVGDHIFVSKFRYGLSLPFQNQQFVSFSKPSYGDVIVFAKPTRQEQGFTDDGQPGELVGTDFIKRVMALPGDRFEIRHSVVYINDRPVKRCRLGHITFKSRHGNSEWWDREGEIWAEQHGDHVYTVVEDELFDDTEPFIVPPNHVLVLGDNRDRSYDSRMFGTVPIPNIRGRAEFIWWSNERPHGFAWHRVGTWIMAPPSLSTEQANTLRRCNFD